MYEIKNIRLEFHFFFRILVGYTLDEIILKIAPTPSQARHHQPWVSNSTAVSVAWLCAGVAPSWPLSVSWSLFPGQKGRYVGTRFIYFSSGADDEGEMYPVARSSEEAVRDECGELVWSSKKQPLGKIIKWEWCQVISDRHDCLLRASAIIIILRWWSLTLFSSYKK